MDPDIWEKHLEAPGFGPALLVLPVPLGIEGRESLWGSLSQCSEVGCEGTSGSAGGAPSRVTGHLTGPGFVSVTVNCWKEDLQFVEPLK